MIIWEVDSINLLSMSLITGSPNRQLITDNRQHAKESMSKICDNKSFCLGVSSGRFST